MQPAITHGGYVLGLGLVLGNGRRVQLQHSAGQAPEVGGQTAGPLTGGQRTNAAVAAQEAHGTHFTHRA